MRNQQAVTLIVVLLVFALVSPNSYGQSGILFIGELQWTKVIPEYSDSSNSCGRAVTNFRVAEVFFGPELSSVELHDIIGEWCHPPYGTEPRKLFLSAKRGQEVWEGGIHEPIHLDSEGRRFIAPTYDGVLFGCSIETWREYLAEDYPYRIDHELPEVRQQHLLKKGYVRKSGQSLLVNSVIYLDKLPSLATSSSCLQSRSMK